MYGEQTTVMSKSKAGFPEGRVSHQLKGTIRDAKIVILHIRPG